MIRHKKYKSVRVRIINHRNKYQGRVDVGVNDANVWEGVKLILDNGDAGVCGSTLHCYMFVAGKYLTISGYNLGCQGGPHLI